jgi:CRISPR-associated protein Cmr5
MPTRSQKGAAAVFGQVREAAQLGDPARIRYGGWCHRFPVLVLRAGLAQAAAFLEAKAAGKGAAAEGDCRFRDHMKATLGAGQDLSMRAHNANLVDYRYLTRRTLEVAIWYKRFAESVLDVGAGDEAGEGPDG